MNAAELYLDTIGRSDDALKRAVEGLTTEELRAQPAGPGSNPIGWLIWHLARSRDNITANLAGTEAVWDSQGWAAKFGMEGDIPRFMPDNVNTFDPKSFETIMGYFDTVAAKTAEIVRGLSEQDLDRLVQPMIEGRPAMPVASRLAVILNDNIQHIGQIAYLRGLIRDQGWF